MQNFGEIKNEFNGLLAESLVTKNNISKGLFKNYLKTIKESDILKTQFLIYNSIENKISDDSFSDNLFVNESLKLLEKYKISDIVKENKKLVTLFNNFDTGIKETYDTRLSNLHKALSTLILTKKSPTSVGVVVENLKGVLEYIRENKLKEVTEAINLPNSLLSSIMVDTYNSRYSDLNESDKKTLKILINSTDIEKKELYSSLVKECITLIDENLKTSDLEAKEKLLMVKDKLLNKVSEVSEDFNRDISKLIDLRGNLS